MSGPRRSSPQAGSIQAGSLSKINEEKRAITAARAALVNRMSIRCKRL